MKNNFRFFCIVTLLISSVFLNGCKKDAVADPADQFVGNYSYIITVTGDLSGTDSGDLTVTKGASNKLIMKQSGGTNTYYTVNGNSIEEDSGQTVDLPIQNGGTAAFSENSTGTLSANTLTINGTWSKTGYNIQSFKVIALKK